jgi:hypothetical protein
MVFDELEEQFEKEWKGVREKGWGEGKVLEKAERELGKVEREFGERIEGCHSRLGDRADG